MVWHAGPNVNIYYFLYSLSIFEKYRIFEVPIPFIWGNDSTFMFYLSEFIVASNMSVY